MRLTEGEWEVQTETSTYIVNVDEMAVWRLPGGAGALYGSAEQLALRRDGDRLALLEQPDVVVGEPAVLTLSVRGDGVATFRRTTLVCHLTRLT